MNENELAYLEQMEQLEKEYQQYLKENKDMNDKYPEVYQQAVTFNDWLHSDMSNVDTFNFDDLPF